MGAALTYLEEPNKEKELVDGCSEIKDRFMRHGACEMQGWRLNMEDAQLAVPDLDEQVSLYGVFDGHGGRGVSRFAARELPGIIKETAGWKAGNYQKALEEAFVEVDVQLRTESGRKAIEELDKPDPKKQRRLLQVPRRMVERFQRGQAMGSGEDEEGDMIDLNDMDEQFEGEEEEGMNFEADPEVDEDEADKTENVTPAEPAADPASDADKSDKKPVFAGEGFGKSPEKSDVAVASSEKPAAAVADPPQADATEVAEEDVGEDDLIDPADDVDDNDDVLIDPSEITRSPNPEAQGCTAVVVLVVHGGADGPRLICGNAGDSRAMVSRGGEVVDLSEDHKPENPGETARIEKAGGFVKDMPGGARVMGDLNLSRAMGDLRYKQKPELPAAEQIVTVFPEVRTVPFQPGEDEFLVLGCDGIWETNTNQDAVDYVRSRLLVKEGSSEPPALSKICAEICDRGLCPAMDASCDGKGCDNMTVMVVQLKPRVEGKPRVLELKRPLGVIEGDDQEPPSKRQKESA